MIEKINIRKVATYDDTDHPIEELKKINFFFGNNGSGKTTISRIIRNIYEYKDSCSIEWKNKAPIEAKVYNRDFVKENFQENQNLKGIFTLGKEEAETKQRIESTKKQIEELEQKIADDINSLGNEEENTGKYKELSDFTNQAISDFWKEKTKLDNKELKNALHGYLNSREKFFNQVLEKKKQGIISKKSFDELEIRAKKIFSNIHEKYELITDIDFSRLLEIENDAILKKHIVGKGDIDIKELINYLNNSDWVQSGIKYISKANGKCPFCQQPLPEDFENKLGQYFDKSYENDKNALQSLIENFHKESNLILSKLNQLNEKDIPIIDKNVVTEIVEDFNSYIREAKLIFQDKTNNLSKEVSIASVKNVETRLHSLIDSINTKITENNTLVENLSSEKNNLINDVWGVVINNLDDEIKNYNQKIDSINSEIINLKNKIQDNTNRKTEMKSVLQELEKQQVSVIPTKDEINKILLNFGFTSFKLDIGDDEYSYKIIRNDGTPVEDKLSEGEQSFIAFLYFYQLLKGNHQETTALNDIIVVIDDPVSSMDSDVLYIVSTLIRKLTNAKFSENKRIKQIFVLTHNLFFFKEVGFEKFLDDKSYYIVKKINDKSTIEYCGDKNPIKSSYELLWQQLGISKNQNNLFALQNTMRRILEYYFVLNGTVKKLHNLPEQYNDSKRDICKALISWINTGSHSVFDDLYYPPNSESDVQRYLDVFEDIFKRTNQYEHYKMMMKIDEDVGT